MVLADEDQGKVQGDGGKPINSNDPTTINKQGDEESKDQVKVSNDKERDVTGPKINQDGENGKQPKKDVEGNTPSTNAPNLVSTSPPQPSTEGTTPSTQKSSLSTFPTTPVSGGTSGSTTEAPNTTEKPCKEPEKIDQLITRCNTTYNDAIRNNKCEEQDLKEDLMDLLKQLQEKLRTQPNNREAMEAIRKKIPCALAKQSKSICEEGVRAKDVAARAEYENCIIAQKHPTSTQSY